MCVYVNIFVCARNSTYANELTDRGQYMRCGSGEINKYIAQSEMRLNKHMLEASLYTIELQTFEIYSDEHMIVDWNNHILKLAPLRRWEGHKITTAERLLRK